MSARINSSLHPHPYLPVHNSNLQENGRIQETWEKKRLEFQRLIQVAQERQIDISEHLTKMQQVITDQPAADALHQIDAIKILYEIKMYEKYNREIDHTIAKHGLFYEKAPEPNKLKKGPKTLAERRKQNRLEYRKLIQIAQEKKVDTSEQVSKMQQVKNSLPDINDFHQSRPIKLTYQMLMYQKYIREIGPKIAKFTAGHLFYEKKPVFHMFKVTPKTLIEKWKANRAEYKKLIKIANDKQVDISKYTCIMQQVIADLPPSNDPHQALPIRLRYEIKMYEKYNREISRLIHKHGYFQKEQEVLLKDLEWRIRDINYSYEKWIQIAADYNIDIQEYTGKMQEAVNSLPSAGQPNQFSSVAMLYNVKLRKIYCVDIIRKVAEVRIRRLAKEAKTTPGLEHLMGMIKGCKKFLLKNLPGANRKSMGEPNIEEAESQYTKVMDKMEEMSEKIMKKGGIAGQPIVTAGRPIQN